MSAEYTHQDAQDLLAILANDTETPAEGDEDWNIRQVLLNDGIQSWEDEEGVDWTTLYATLADAADGTKQTDGSARSFDAPSDFRRLVGEVRLDNGFVPVYKAWEIQGLNRDSQFAYVTGKPGAYKITFNLVPDADLSIDYDYFRAATLLDDPTDSFDMTRPRYAVYRALAQINRLASDTSGYNANMQQAENAMDAMRNENVAPGYGQDAQIPDGFDGGFGR